MPIRIIRIVTPEGDIINITVPLVETPPVVDVSVQRKGRVYTASSVTAWEPTELPYRVEVR